MPCRSILIPRRHSGRFFCRSQLPPRSPHPEARTLKFSIVKTSRQPAGRSRSPRRAGVIAFQIACRPLHRCRSAATEPGLAGFNRFDAKLLMAIGCEQLGRAHEGAVRTCANRARFRPVHRTSGLVCGFVSGRMIVAGFDFGEADSIRAFASTPGRLSFRWQFNPCPNLAFLVKIRAGVDLGRCMRRWRAARALPRVKSGGRRPIREVRRHQDCRSAGSLNSMIAG